MPELENVIERAVTLSPKNNLFIPELQTPLKHNNPDSKHLLPLTELERSHIIKVLKTTDWEISGEEGAASILEMHPNTLRSRMSKLGIRRYNTIPFIHDISSTVCKVIASPCSSNKYLSLYFLNT